MLSDKHIRIALHVVAEDLTRRRRHGHPIPAVLRDLYNALCREVSGIGHDACESDDGAEQLETAQQRAERLGVSERTIRRHAARNGHQMIAGRYLFATEGPQ